MIFDLSNIENAIGVFYNVLHDLNVKFVSKYKKRHDNYAPWVDGEMKRLIRAKKIVHINYKHSRTQEDYARFSRLRSFCENKIRYLRDNYIRCYVRVVGINK